MNDPAEAVVDVPDLLRIRPDDFLTGCRSTSSCRGAANFSAASLQARCMRRSMILAWEGRWIRV